MLAMKCIYTAQGVFLSFLSYTLNRHLFSTQVKLLADEGGANVWVKDRWGKTSHDEARRVGATAVAEFLAAEMAKHPEGEATEPSPLP